MKKRNERRENGAGRLFRRLLGTCAAGAVLLFPGNGALAAGDPIAVVNNLSDFIFGVIRAVGIILLKLAAERLDRLFIVRTAWVFGANGKNFVKTMLRLGAARDDLRVVNDQIGTPTYTADLARLLADMAQTNRYGVYHASNEGGYVSWCDFAREIFRQAGMDTRVLGVSTAEYGLSLARRPLNSRLDKSGLAEAGFSPLPDWRDALGRFLKEIGYGTDQR